MKHENIKTIVEKVGLGFFPDFFELFSSEITSDKDTNRYSLKIRKEIPNEPLEIKITNLTTRFTTNFTKRGEDCKEIGIPGRFIFDKLESDKLFFKKVYLTKTLGTGFANLKNKIIVSHFDCPKSYNYLIDKPHFATVLNFHDLPKENRAIKVEKFVSLYFQFISINKNIL